MEKNVSLRLRILRSDLTLLGIELDEIMKSDTHRKYRIVLIITAGQSSAEHRVNIDNHQQDWSLRNMRNSPAQP